MNENKPNQKFIPDHQPAPPVVVVPKSAEQLRAEEFHRAEALQEAKNKANSTVHLRELPSDVRVLSDMRAKVAVLLAEFNDLVAKAESAHQQAESP